MRLLLGAFLTLGGVGLLVLFFILGPMLTVLAWNHLIPLTRMPVIDFTDALAAGWLLAAVGGAFKSTQTITNHVHEHKVNRRF